MTEWQALVLAGSRGSSDPVAVAANISHKAFLPLAGKPMIAHVVRALQATSNIRDIAVSIEPDVPALPLEVRRLDAAFSPATSVLAAFDQLPIPFLITTADNPLLTSDTLQQFLEAAEKSDADVVAGVSSRQVIEKAGEGGHRTYLKFSDYHVSGCNLFAIKTSKGRNAITFWKKLEQNRKKPWRMAFEIGLLSLVQYLVHLLSSEEAVRRLGKKMDCEASLIFLDDPYAAHDVDKPEDIAFAERCLAKR